VLLDTFHSTRRIEDRFLSDGSDKPARRVCHSAQVPLKAASRGDRRQPSAARRRHEVAFGHLRIEETGHDPSHRTLELPWTEYGKGRKPPAFPHHGSEVKGDSIRAFTEHLPVSLRTGQARTQERAGKYLKTVAAVPRPAYPAETRQPSRNHQEASPKITAHTSTACLLAVTITGPAQKQKVGQTNRC